MKRAYRRLAPIGSTQPRTIEEFLAPDRVWVTPWACWIWLGGDDGRDDPDGLGAYGRILRPGTRLVMPVHKYSFELFKGPVPVGYHVDHLCAAWFDDKRLVRRCCNPDHLEAVTPAENQRRKILRRLGYLDDEPPPQRHYHEPPPILAPGETDEDMVL